MNKVVLMGWIVADPDVREIDTKNGDITVASYTIGVRRNSDESDFIRCKAFDKAGDFAADYFGKGTKVCISGRLQSGSYEHKDGYTVYTTELIVESQEFAESKHEKENDNDEEREKNSRSKGSGNKSSDNKESYSRGSNRRANKG